jgi:hypothetical protein
MQTHSAFKNYNCKRCHKSFALKSYLNKHYESACFKDLPMPDIDTPPSTPSPPSLPDGPDISESMGYGSDAPASSSPAAYTSSAPSEAATKSAPSQHHVIHVPRPVFPSSAHLIRV